MKPDTAPLFVGCATALVTPMLPAPAGDGYTPPPVDYEAFVRLVRRQITAGVDALVVCGTTGESSTLTDEEKLRLFSLAVQESRRAEAEGIARRHIPVIAGTGSNNTARAVTLSRLAEKAGCDGLLAVTPYYNKCTQAGLIAHYTAAADTVPCPVIVYNVPSRTGVDVSVETCRALCAHPNIGGIKEASGSVPKAMRILDACAEELPLWSGNDDLTVPLMAVGARGVISVLSNVRPKLTLQMVRACQTGEYAQAGRIQTALMGLVDALFCEVNPIPVKQALALEGIPAGLPRLPLTPLSGSHLPVLEQMLSAMPEP